MTISDSILEIKNLDSITNEYWTFPFTDNFQIKLNTTNVSTYNSVCDLDRFRGSTRAELSPIVFVSFCSDFRDIQQMEFLKCFSRSTTAYIISNLEVF